MPKCAICGFEVTAPWGKVCPTKEDAVDNLCPSLGAAILRSSPSIPSEPNDEFARRARQKDRLIAIALKQALKTFDKDKEYASSWRQRNGVGAYFTIVRKWDRIENAAQAKTFMDKPVQQYDLFQRFELDRREEGILDDVMDLVGYCLVLVEHMMECGYAADILKQSPKIYDPSDLDGPVPEPRIPRRSIEPAGQPREGVFYVGELGLSHTDCVFSTDPITGKITAGQGEVDPRTGRFKIPCLECAEMQQDRVGKVNHPMPYGYKAEEENA